MKIYCGELMLVRDEMKKLILSLVLGTSTFFSYGQDVNVSTSFYSYSEVFVSLKKRDNIYFHGPNKDSTLFLGSTSDIADLTVDHLNQTIYFLSANRTVLEQCDLNGGNRRILWSDGGYNVNVGGTFISGIDYDFKKRLAFLAINESTGNRFDEDIIIKLNLTSKETTELKSTGQTDSEEYRGLALDTLNKVVYYGIEPLGIYSNNYDFTNEQLILEESVIDGRHSNMTINSAQGTLYYTDDFGITSDPNPASFYVINLNGSGFMELGDTLNIGKGIIYDFEKEQIRCFSENGHFLSFDLSGSGAQIVSDPTMSFFSKEQFVNEDVRIGFYYDSYFFFGERNIYKRKENASTLDLVLKGSWDDMRYMDINNDSKNLYFVSYEIEEFEPSQSGGEFYTGTRFYKVDSTGGNWVSYNPTDASTGAFNVVNDFLFYVSNEYVERNNTYNSRLLRVNLNSLEDPDVLAEREDYIMRDIEINPDGSSGYFSQQNIEVDWSTNLRYFLAENGESVIQLDDNGNEVAIDVNLMDNPTLLRINQEENKLYWVNESATNPGLFSVDLDGSNAGRVLGESFSNGVEIYEFAYGRNTTNKAPIISSQAFTINENSATETVIGRILATDENEDELTFSILSGNTNDAFALSTIGELSVQNSSELDFETTPSFSLEVEVNDGNGGTASATITVNLNDIDESANTDPVILDQPFMINENTSNATVIGQVEASDPDQDELAYSILSGNTNDAFALSASGELSVKTSAALDFETTPSFSLEIEVNDGNGGTAQATITINLNDIDENTAPTIADQTFTIDENAVNATVIGQLEASDADKDELTYYILSGNTNDAFALSVSGELSVKTSAALDFETTPSFNLEIEVNDVNGGTAQATITINLNDVYENTDPTISNQTFTIDENAVNATVIGQLEASDADGDELTYSILSGNTNDAFALSARGELSVATSTELDFETTPSFSLQVEVNDGNEGTAQATITINLNDLDENTDPTISNQTFIIDENAVNATVIGQVEASDADGDELTYSILSGNTNNAFALSARGELSVATSTELDFETTPSFSLEVEVNDGNGGTAQATITINLNDVDENTAPTIADQTFTIDENAVNATVIGQLEASDADGDELTYSILSGNTNDAFALSANGELSVATSTELDFETTPSFSLEVEVNDGNGGDVQAIISINLENIDETRLLPNTYTLSESSPSGTRIGGVGILEENTDLFPFFETDQIDQTNEALLKGVELINSGALEFSSENFDLILSADEALDYESFETFEVIVKLCCFTMGEEPNATITVNVTNVNEATSMEDQTFSVDENSVFGTTIGQLEAYDEDGDDLHFSILSGNTNDVFALSIDGKITVQNELSLDYETSPSFELEVEVIDGNGGADTAIISIDLVDLEEKDPLGVYSKLAQNFFPNPTNGIVSIKTSQFLNETGILIDFSGKKIFEVQLNQGDTTMDLHLLPAGIYLFKVGDQAVKITKIE